MFVDSERNVASMRARQIVEELRKDRRRRMVENGESQVGLESGRMAENG
jgi:hypothetical protein